MNQRAQIASFGTLLTLLVLPAPSQMADATASEAVLGSYFERSSGAIYRLEGIPSSAILGGRQSELKFVRAATGAGHGLGVDAADGTAWLLRGGRATKLAGVHSGAARVALSPSGRSAAFYSEDRAAVQVVSGLPEAPRLVWEATLPGPVSLLAVSDDGEAVASVGDRGLALVTAHHPPQVLLRQANALAFVAGARRLLAAEPEQNAVWSIDADSGAASLLMDQRDGLEAVAAVAASADGRRVFVALESGRIAIRAAAGGMIDFVTCSCIPSRLSPLRGPAAFLLNDPQDQDETLWVLDAGRPDPGVAFVARKAKVTE